MPTTTAIILVWITVFLVALTIIFFGGAMPIFGDYSKLQNELTKFRKMYRDLNREKQGLQKLTQHDDTKLQEDNTKLQAVQQKLPEHDDTKLQEENAELRAKIDELQKNIQSQHRRRSSATLPTLTARKSIDLMTENEENEEYDPLSQMTPRLFRKQSSVRTIEYEKQPDDAKILMLEGEISGLLIDLQKVEEELDEANLTLDRRAETFKKIGEALQLNTSLLTEKEVLKAIADLHSELAKALELQAQIQEHQLQKIPVSFDIQQKLKEADEQKETDNINLLKMTQKISSLEEDNSKLKKIVAKSNEDLKSLETTLVQKQQDINSLTSQTKELHQLRGVRQHIQTALNNTPLYLENQTRANIQIDEEGNVSINNNE